MIADKSRLSPLCPASGEWINAVLNEDLARVSSLLAQLAGVPAHATNLHYALSLAIHYESVACLELLCQDPRIDPMGPCDNQMNRLQNAITQHRFAAALCLWNASDRKDCLSPTGENLAKLVVGAVSSATAATATQLMLALVADGVGIDVNDHQGKSARDVLHLLAHLKVAPEFSLFANTVLSAAQAHALGILAPPANAPMQRRGL